MPTCPICSKEMKYINNSHLKAHGLTPTQFKDIYPEVEAIPKEIREKNKQNSEKRKAGSKLCKEEQHSKRIEVYNCNPKKCLKCECVIPYEKKRNNFCSQTCAGLTNSIGRKVTYSEEGKKAQRESGLKNSINFLKSSRRKKVINYKKCVICESSYITKKNISGRKTCNDNCLKKYQSLHNAREGNTKTKFGYYKDIYCASSWELAFLVYNLDLGKEIRRCELNFSYIMGEEEKTYFPDFLMEDKIYEVKGRELEDVALKTQVVLDAGYQIELIRKKEITPIIKFLKEKYGIKDLTQLYDKKI